MPEAPTVPTRARRRFDLLPAHLAGAVVAAALTVVALPLVPPGVRPRVAFGGLLVALLNHLLALFLLGGARRLAARGEHFRSMVSGANDLILVVGADLTVRWQSPAAARLFALADADVVGRRFADLIHPDDAAAASAVLTGVLDRERPWSGRPPLVAARLRDGHGAWRDTEATVSDQLDVPEVAALVIHVRDVGERRRLEHTARQLALTDQLTGLANRRELMRAIVTQRAVPDHLGALLVVDLHGLAALNDGSGRAAGDAVLVEAGRRLRAAVRDDDVVARLAGDEFAVVTVDGPMLAYALATRLLTVLAEPYLLPEATAHLQASVGLAELSAGDAVDDLLHRADLARRRATQLGRNRVEWYDSRLEEQLLRRLDLERELPGAIRRGELDLVYQPVVGLADGVPVGMEALLRWRSPILGTVLPAELLPVAEDLGLVEEIGQWVAHRACRQLADWSWVGRRLWMAVNVSPAELACADAVGRYAETLATHQLAADRLVVEVAEPRLTADVTLLASRLTGLRELGVRTALDDFGAAQASLAHLRRLPFDYLKIDRGTLGEATPGGTGPLIGVVAGLGRRMGWEVIAEGLESAGQIEQAREAGCRLGQGFALARPAPAERVEAYLAEFPGPSR